jgi:hypothetical protein
VTSKFVAVPARSLRCLIDVGRPGLSAERAAIRDPGVRSPAVIGWSWMYHCGGTAFGQGPTSMHGEYKVPGGKLVVADLEIHDGKLTDVVISGDFFLEPAEALARITRSLQNLPADSTEEEIAEQVRRSLEPGVEMIGFSAEAVAIAVRRAIE